MFLFFSFLCPLGFLPSSLLLGLSMEQRVLRGRNILKRDFASYPLIFIHTEALCTVLAIQKGIAFIFSSLDSPQHV